MFQLLRNNHEVIIWGPPLGQRDGLLKELELIELLLNSVDFDDIWQATLYIAWDGHARLIPQEQRFFQIPYLAGYPCIDKSQLQVTEWIQAGWKHALLDGVRPVDLGVLHPSDSSQVYTAFLKLQQCHIYLLDGHDMEPSAILIVDDKVRFVDMALKRWFSPNILIYDQTIHDEQQLKQAVSITLEAG
ncbi:hypothetical protein F5146DRAFT_1001714 [Armillaria mellea]|nr:hypothetical protein F5146DRAFT_1001714 [Armillaria mellea]